MHPTSRADVCVFGNIQHGVQGNRNLIKRATCAVRLLGKNVRLCKIWALHKYEGNALCQQAQQNLLTMNNAAVHVWLI